MLNTPLSIPLSLSLVGSFYLYMLCYVKMCVIKRLLEVVYEIKYCISLSKVTIVDVVLSSSFAFYHTIVNISSVSNLSLTICKYSLFNIKFESWSLFVALIYWRVSMGSGIFF